MIHVHGISQKSARSTSAAIPLVIYGARRPWNILDVICAGQCSTVWMWRPVPTWLSASTYAGIGFGNAGVHVPHAIAYPVAGMVKNFSPPDYPKEEPMIPHGLSVIVTAPSTFRWTYPVNPERHLRAAQLLGADVNGLTSAEMPEVLPRTLLSMMSDTGIPNGLTALGYGESRRIKLDRRHAQTTATACQQSAKCWC